ncbi:MAG: bifunctional hydroxymethylpyrimidine kinase/phosphomethylpyrimidine kinase [Pseudomonadota bacterium]
MQARVLVIAGSDPSGGAGVQADIKTVTALGGYAAAAITALTVQNTRGVQSVRMQDASFIRDQIDAVITDIGVDAVKIGMIGDIEAAAAIADILTPHAASTPIVVDPVLIATSGDALASDGMAGAIMDRLAPIATVLTPNIDEASALTGRAIADSNGAQAAGEALREAGARAALVKGAHLVGGTITDFLVTADGVSRFANERIGDRALHGTGCTLASALATRLAYGDRVETATQAAIGFVRAAIRLAPGFGDGAAPLNHAGAGAAVRADGDKPS